MTNSTLVAEDLETSLCFQRGFHPASSHTEHTALGAVCVMPTLTSKLINMPGSAHTQYLEDAGTQ